MAIALKIPSSGESISEVQVGQWRRSEGDRVQLDEVLVEIETDKAAMDLPAPASGILTKILKKDGEEAAVGEVIAYIEESGDGAGEAASAARTLTAESPAAPVAPPPEHAGSKAPLASEPASEEPRVMPAARRALAEHGLKPTEVEATGPGGRLLKEDVERHAAARTPDKAVSPRAESKTRTAAPVAPAGPLEGQDGREEQVVPMSPMRRIIAQKLVAAQQNAALLTTFNEIDMSAVIALRKRHQEVFRRKHGVKLGFMSFFVKASIEALKLYPQVNAEIRDNKIVYRNFFDVGIAVGGGKGLVVPVLRNAERMSFADIELAIADLARRASENALDLAELKGGTFTISNGGIYGSMLSTPIVNPPQSGILGLHAIQDRPVAVDGQVLIRPMMYVALTYDHRLVDGREAVTCLRHIKSVIEEPVRILIEI